MADEPMNERQGHEVIALLRDILTELKDIKSAVRWEINNGIKEANATLDRIEETGIGD